MRSICFVAGVLLISAAIAAEQPRSTAEELVAEVSGLLARGVSDKKIAGSIEKVHLSDCLTDKLIADLTKQYRIGPYTTFALDIQANESQALMPSADTIPSDLAPSADQIDLMTDRLRKYVDQSLASWKKFVAKSSITRLANYKGEFRVQSGKIWYPHERFQFELPESVNTPIGHLRYLQGATFHWHHWDFCGGRKVAVFDFAESPDSPFHRTLRRELDKAPYQHGRVFFFPEDGTVCRLVARDSTSSATTVFGPIQIDGSTYWFSTSVIIMTRFDQLPRHPLWRRRIWIPTEYHRVDAQSTVTYSPPGV